MSAVHASSPHLAECHFPDEVISVDPILQDLVEDLLEELRSNDLRKDRLSVICDDYLPLVLDALDENVFSPIADLHVQGFPGRQASTVRQHIRFGVGKAIESWDLHRSVPAGVGREGESSFDRLVRLSSHISAFGTGPLTDRAFHVSVHPHGSRQTTQIVNLLLKKDHEQALSFFRFYLEGKNLREIAKEDSKPSSQVEQELAAARKIVLRAIPHVLFEYRDQGDDLSQLALPSIGSPLATEVSGSFETIGNHELLSHQPPRAGSKTEKALQLLLEIIGGSVDKSAPRQTIAQLATQANVSRGTMRNALDYLTPTARSFFVSQRKQDEVRETPTQRRRTERMRALGDVGQFLEEVGKAHPAMGFNEACPILQELRALRIEALLKVLTLPRMAEELSRVVTKKSSPDDFSPGEALQNHVRTLGSIAELIRDFQKEVPYAERFEKREQLSMKVCSEVGSLEERKAQSIVDPSGFDKFWDAFDVIVDEERALRSKVARYFSPESLTLLDAVLEDSLADSPSSCEMIAELFEQGVPLRKCCIVRDLLEQGAAKGSRVHEPSIVSLLGEQQGDRFIEQVRDALDPNSLLTHFAQSHCSEDSSGMAERLLCDLRGFYFRRGVTPRALNKLCAEISPLREAIEEKSQEILDGHVLFVVSVAKKIRARTFDLRGKTGYGITGMMHAIRHFQSERGQHLTTYATSWVHRFIRTAVMHNDELIKVPTSYYVGQPDEWQAFYGALSYFNGQGREPSASELAKRLSWEEDKVEEFLTLIEARRVSRSHSVESLFSSNGIFEEESDPWNSLSLTNSPSGRREVDDAVPDSVARQEQDEIILELVNELRPRERTVLFMRYGLGQGELKREHTLEEIGTVLKITRERVRQIQKNALKRLKTKARARHLLPEGLRFLEPLE